MAKLVAGIAPDLASTALLATDKRVLMAPAMNVRMWNHASTQRNVALLKKDGVLFVGPNAGEMACGEFGPGRMAEPLEIVAAVEDALVLKDAPLAGTRALVTAGPTHEPLDPVRFLANRSSGKQGYAIAEAFVAAGADTILVSGPVDLSPPPRAKVYRVETAREMMAACESALPVDVAVFSAAVADWRPALALNSKMKKQDGQLPPSVALEANPDILATISQGPRRPSLVVGFAAETEDVIAHAKSKLAKKRCDWIIANDVSPASGVMGGDRNSVHLIRADATESWPELDKIEVGRRLVARIAETLKGRAA
jgi:phosphopantothenoylcysteine decarboxylase/phosphopantothenate--cysteine ligase